MIVGFISPLSGQYLFHNLTEEKGLTSNHINCIMEDVEGFIWLGTNSGLCRFDGDEVIVFRHDPVDPNSVCDDDIRSIYQDRYGLIWVGTIRGVSVYSSGTGLFKNYFHDPADQTSLSNDKVQFLTGDDSGFIYIATDANGLDIFDPQTGTFSNLLPSEQTDARPARFVNTFIGYAHDPGESNIIWFGTQTGVLRFNTLTKKFRHYPLDPKAANNPQMISERERVVRDILLDDGGKLWLATWGGGLCHFDPANGKYDIYKYEPMHPATGYRNNIVRLQWKTDNEIWILAPNRGIAVFNILKKEFHFLVDELQEEMAVNPSDILQDENGFVWISSYSNGLLFTNRSAHQFSKTAIPHPLHGLTVSDKNPDLFYTSIPGIYGRLLIYDTREKRYAVHGYTPHTDQAENNFHGFVPAADRLWLVECYDLYLWDDNAKEVKYFPGFDPMASKVSEATLNPYLISACIAKSGELWIGTTFNGIFRFNPGDNKTINYYYPDELAGNIYLKNFIHVLFTDSKDRVWYGSTEFGYFDTEKQKFVNLSLGRDFPEAPVKSAIFKSITETPDGHIWLGTVNSGIQVIDPNEPKSFIGSYMSHDGLTGSLIHDMSVDRNGHVWAITNSGLSRINPQTREIENYGREYGLAHLREITTLANGDILILANWGFYRFDPGTVGLFDNNLKPYIKLFRVFDQPLDLNYGSDEKGRVSLRPDQKFFSIEYGAINFFDPEQTTFSYLLEGFDQQWTMAGDRRYVSYTNLPGGDYTFRLRASAGSGRYEEISLTLFIGTSFWKTPWFYLMIIMVISIMVFGLFRYRIHQVRRQEEIRAGYNKTISQLEMKALRAQMNPHFLFNSLNSIRYYILKEDLDNASDYITKFSKLLRLILRNSRQNMITLAEELETLSIYVEFEQMRFGKSFDFKKRIDPAVKPDDIMIQPMTIQPFIENAIWHGLMPKEDDRKLSLSISQKDDYLTIVVEDNGIGRNEAKALKQDSNMGETKSYGLQITSERFDMLQKARGKRSEFEITDLTDSEGNAAGTKVTIHYEI
jgi:ligand-binding sensor domain-containing protein/two-component sensor histidine kinase